MDSWILDCHWFFFVFAFHKSQAPQVFKSTQIGLLSLTKANEFKFNLPIQCWICHKILLSDKSRICVISKGKVTNRINYFFLGDLFIWKMAEITSSIYLTSGLLALVLAALIYPATASIQCSYCGIRQLCNLKFDPGKFTL